MVLYYGGAGVTLSNKLGFTDIGLASGQTYTIPGGWYYVKPGPYSCLQVYDPVLATWRGIGGEGTGNAQPHYVSSDGNNYRLANLTGCTVGASVTNVGSGYTSAPTVTISGQNSIWRAVVGGAVSQTVVVSNGGSNYTYPPAILFSSPPSGGIQATGYAALSGGALSTITMVNQGGGYTSPPTISIVNDPREGINNVTLGFGASAVCSLTGAQTIAGIVCVDPGTGGRTAVPSFTFSGGGGSSLAATPVMCWSILSYTPTSGAGYTTSSLLSGLDAFPAANTTILNPAIQSQWVKTKQAVILMPATAGAPTATGAVFYDGGIYTSVPTSLVTTGGELITTSATITFGMGGNNDTSHIWS